MKRNKLVTDVLCYIEEHLQEDLSLDELESKLNYSKYHMNRQFAKEMNCTIHKYIQLRRLSEAARELVDTKKPIIDIALDAKYNSPQAFTLAFQQVYHVSPRNYRKNGIFIPKLSSNIYSVFMLYERRMAA